MPESRSDGWLWNQLGTVADQGQKPAPRTEGRTKKLLARGLLLHGTFPDVGPADLKRNPHATDSTPDSEALCS